MTSLIPYFLRSCARRRLPSLTIHMQDVIWSRSPSRKDLASQEHDGARREKSYDAGEGARMASQVSSIESWSDD